MPFQDSNLAEVTLLSVSDAVARVTVDFLQQSCNLLRTNWALNSSSCSLICFSTRKVYKVVVKTEHMNFFFSSNSYMSYEVKGAHSALNTSTVYWYLEVSRVFLSQASQHFPYFKFLIWLESSLMFFFNFSTGVHWLDEFSDSPKPDGGLEGMSPLAINNLFLF